MFLIKVRSRVRGQDGIGAAQLHKVLLRQAEQRSAMPLPAAFRRDPEFLHAAQARLIEPAPGTGRVHHRKQQEAGHPALPVPADKQAVRRGADLLKQTLPVGHLHAKLAVIGAKRRLQGRVRHIRHQRIRIHHRFLPFIAAKKHAPVHEACLISAMSKGEAAASTRPL